MCFWDFNFNYKFLSWVYFSWVFINKEVNEGKMNINLV